MILMVVMGAWWSDDCAQDPLGHCHDSPWDRLQETPKKINGELA